MQSSVGIEPNGSARKSCARPETTTREPRRTSVSIGGDDALVEELHLVDADRVVAGREPQHLGARLGGDRAHLHAGVRDDMAEVVAVVDHRLHDQRPLARDLGAAQAPDQLLALAAEHRPADDLEPTAAVWMLSDHGGEPTGATRRTRSSACSRSRGGGRGGSPPRGTASRSARPSARRRRSRARIASRVSASPMPWPRADSSTITSSIRAFRPEETR